MPSVTCPCCGRDMQQTPPAEMLLSAHLSRIERIIVEALVSAYPRSVGTEHLISAIYDDDPEGGPLSPRAVIKVRISWLRGKLQQYGWNIANNRGGAGNFGRYKLEAKRHV